MIITEYYVNVADLMLPRPRLRDNILDIDRAESLSELPLIAMKCRDCDYR
jgi:hypothetical protein